MVGEVDHHPTDDGLNVQAIPVSDSPEMPFHGQSAPETALLMDLREVSPTHTGVQKDIPSKQVTSQPDKATSTRTGHSRPLLPDWLLVNSYIPAQGQAFPMEEVSAPGLEGAQEIINRWKPFNQGESPAARMHQLYPTLLRYLWLCGPRGMVKSTPSQSLPMLVRTISGRWLKTTCKYVTETSSNRWSW